MSHSVKRFGLLFSSKSALARVMGLSGAGFNSGNSNVFLSEDDIKSRLKAKTDQEALHELFKRYRSYVWLRPDDKSSCNMFLTSCLNLTQESVKPILKEAPWIEIALKS